MARQNKYRKLQLQPERMDYAKCSIDDAGYEITFECSTRLEFIFHGSKVMFYPYTGWATGATIQDGRGIDKLITQITNDC